MDSDSPPLPSLTSSPNMCDKRAEAVRQRLNSDIFDNDFLYRLHEWKMSLEVSLAHHDVSLACQAIYSIVKSDILYSPEMFSNGMKAVFSIVVHFFRALHRSETTKYELGVFRAVSEHIIRNREKYYEKSGSAYLKLGALCLTAELIPGFNKKYEYTSYAAEVIHVIQFNFVEAGTTANWAFLGCDTIGVLKEKLKRNMAEKEFELIYNGNLLLNDQTICSIHTDRDINSDENQVAEEVKIIYVVSVTRWPGVKLGNVQIPKGWQRTVQFSKQGRAQKQETEQKSHPTQIFRDYVLRAEKKMKRAFDTMREVAQMAESEHCFLQNTQILLDHEIQRKLGDFDRVLQRKKMEFDAQQKRKWGGFEALLTELGADSVDGACERARELIQMEQRLDKMIDELE